MAASGLGSRARRAAPFALLLTLFAAALSLAGGARLEPADFTFNNGSEVTTLDPATVTGIPEGRVIRALFEGLVIRHPATLEPLPGAAERWEVSADGRTYTFRIRDGARWTNGDPLTASDFVYSFQRVLDPRTAAYYAYQLWYVEGARAYTQTVAEDGSPAQSFDTVAIRAPDARTLVLTLEAPTPFFLDLMGFYPLFPVNRRSIEEARERWPESWRLEWLRPENIVTNGPFRVAERRVNDRIRLVKNPSYWDADHVAFDSIDILAIEQDSTMLNVYLTGGADFIDRVSTSVAPQLLPREDFNPAPYLATYFYRVNTKKPPFDDKRVRRALALTIPRAEICENVMRMGQVPAWSLVPPGIDGYTGAEMTRGTVEEARRLLAEAGYGPGGEPFPPIEIHYNTSDAHSSIAQVISLAWSRELGVQTKLRNEEWKVYLDTQNTLRYDVSRSSWIGDYADPNTYSDVFVTGGENNKTGWGNPEYDRLVAAATAEFDPVARLDLLRRAEAILVDELPVLPIYFYVTQNVVAPRLGGFCANALDEHFPKHWYWMDDEELAAKRAQQPAEWQIVAPHGPPQGKYSPAARARREARR